MDRDGLSKKGMLNALRDWVIKNRWGKAITWVTIKVFNTTKGTTLEKSKMVPFVVLRLLL